MMDRKSWAWAISGGGNPRDSSMHRAMREVAEAMLENEQHHRAIRFGTSDADPSISPQLVITLQGC